MEDSMSKYIAIIYLKRPGNTDQPHWRQWVDETRTEIKEFTAENDDEAKKEARKLVNNHQMSQSFPQISVIEIWSVNRKL